MEDNKLKCSSCKEMKHLSKFSKSKTTRGYQYTCKDCSTTNVVHRDTKTLQGCHKGSVLMNALLNCPHYNTFIKIINEASDDINDDAIFKLVAKKYPDYYYDVYMALKSKCKKTQDTCNAEDTKQTNNVSESYINQYKNDENMTQVGEDIESDHEHRVMTVRSGDKWCKVKVKKSDT